MPILLIVRILQSKKVAHQFGCVHRIIGYGFRGLMMSQREGGGQGSVNIKPIIVKIFQTPHAQRILNPKPFSIKIFSPHINYSSNLQSITFTF